MTTRDGEMLLAKVRKLLAKAEDPACTPAEAEAFNAKATELIAKYGIDAALAYAAGALKDSVSNRLIVLDDPYARAKAQLLVEIASALRVKTILNNGASRRIAGFQVHLFGFDSDIERVEILLTSLLVQAAHGLAGAQPPEILVPTAGALKAYRRDWLYGFGIQVRRRLEAAEERAARAENGRGAVSTELVLVDRTKLVEKAVVSAYPDAGRARIRQVAIMLAFNSGKAAGDKADLGAGRINGTTNNMTLSGRN